MKEVQNPQNHIPLSPSVGADKSLFIKTPREKLAYCKGERIFLWGSIKTFQDFMFDIWDELRQKEEKIEALQQELEAMRK